MTRSRRTLATAFAVALGILGWVGVASASDYGQQRSEDRCIPANDHSGTDLSRYPDCPGSRDIRDDPHQEHRGLIQQTDTP